MPANSRWDLIQRLKRLPKGQTESYANIYTGLPTAPTRNVLVNNSCQIISKVYLDLFMKWSYVFPSAGSHISFLALTLSQAISVATSWVEQAEYKIVDTTEISLEISSF